MGKKNSGSLVASTSNRGHRHPRGAGRSAGRGFTGHRGRGGKANRYHDGPGMDERPESAVDDVEMEAIMHVLAELMSVHFRKGIRNKSA